MKKICKDCREVKDKSQFYIRKSNSGGLSKRCKQCHNKFEKKNKDLTNSLVIHTDKLCSNCGESRSIENFYRQKRGKFGVRSECKSCISLANKERYKKLD